MPAPSWVAPYIGIPYRDHGRDRNGCDCWGGVRMVLADVFGVDLPDYSDHYSSAQHQPSVAFTVETGLAECFNRVTVPQPGDMVIMRIAGRPWHCGLLVADHLRLPWPERRHSCSERLDSPMWSRRLDGAYRPRLRR